MSFGFPSTPNAKSFISHPSTTPAGPPPSWMTDKSTTPSGPPPRANFGSSFNPSNNTFARKGFAAPVLEDDMDEDDDDADDAEYDDEIEEELDLPQSTAFVRSTLTSPRGLKRSRDGQVRPNTEMVSIANGLLAARKPMRLVETPSQITRCEDILQDLRERARKQPSKTDTFLADASSQLSAVWSEACDLTTNPGGIGPEAQDELTLAGYLASLLLQIHHPHTIKKKATSSGYVQRSKSSHPRKSASLSLPQALLEWWDTHHRPYPDDFDDIHLAQPSPSAHESFWDIVSANTVQGRFDRVIRLLRDAGWEYADSAIDDGSPSAGYTGRQLENTEEVAARCANTLEQCPGLQYGNWDIKGPEWTMFRQHVRRGLEELDQFAEGSGLDQSLGGSNIFQRSLLDSTMGLSTASRRAESRVPWTVLENIRMIYGVLLGRTDDVLLASQDWLEASLGLTIWWDGSDELPVDVTLNKDSLRKSLAPRPREADVTPLAAYRRRLAESVARVTTDPEDTAFTVDTLDVFQVGLACVAEDSVAAAINILRTYSPLISVSVVELAALGGWLPTSKPSAVLGQGFSKEDLLVLSHAPVSPKPAADSIDRDALLSEWADRLAKEFEGLSPGSDNDRPADSANVEGWELAVAVLNRQEQSTKSAQGISSLLDTMDFSTEERVDKALSVCDTYGLSEQRKSIAERYADHLTSPSSSSHQPPAYGAVLIYYARARSVAKLKSTLALLTSLCLLHSAAMPPRTHIDHKLSTLLFHTRPALQNLTTLDPEAATLLSTHLSGYATLRKFYDLRDQNTLPATLTTSTPLRPLARKRAAANALFNIIQSASDCIAGGLFDPSIEAVIPIDGLLTLFGELLPFLGHRHPHPSNPTPDMQTRILTQQQVFALLAILEDLLACPVRIRENAESLLHASLREFVEKPLENNVTSFSSNGDSAASLIDLHKSLVNSAHAQEWQLLSLSKSLSRPSSDPSSQNAPPVQRAWDWRKPFVTSVADAAAQAVTHVCADLLVRTFREALVREVAAGWGGIVGWS